MGKFLVLFGPKSYNGVWGKLIGVNFYKNGKQYDTQNFVHIVLHVFGGISWAQVLVLFEPKCYNGVWV